MGKPDMQNKETLQFFGPRFVEKKFLDFFNGHGYTLLPSSSLVDDSIPMSFVMSAGWVQIENRIRGGLKHPHNRLENTAFVQNCFRHFDLKNVGESPVHLSLFRMLGAFHFGKICIATQIQRIEELLLNVYRLPPERLWVTYFMGSEVEGSFFEGDRATCFAWKETNIPKDHIIGNPDKQNFWIQSQSGKSPASQRKCGQTTEIFFDRGENLACGPNCHPGCPCGRFIEVVNVLFIQYYMLGNQSIKPLSIPFTEIVVGVERMATIKEGVDDIFHIDALRSLVEVIEDFIPSEGKENHKLINVIADHLRALTFLIADNAPPPGKGGRAFIIRKLMREIFTAMKILKITYSTFIPTILERAVNLYQPYHPAIKNIQPTLLQYLSEESERFEKTLQRGERRLDRMLSKHPLPVLRTEELLEYQQSFGIPQSLLMQMLNQRDIAYPNA